MYTGVAPTIVMLGRRSKRSPGFGLRPPPEERTSASIRSRSVQPLVCDDDRLPVHRKDAESSQLTPVQSRPNHEFSRDERVGGVPLNEDTFRPDGKCTRALDTPVHGATSRVCPAEFSLDSLFS